MGGATSVMPVIRDTLSGLIPSIGRYAVIGCKLQVPPLYTHNNMLMRAARPVQVLQDFLQVLL